MTGDTIRPGRLRVVSMLQNGVLDPHMTHSFLAFIAPDLISAEIYMKTQPMGTYIFVQNISRSKSFWKKSPMTSDLVLSIMVKFRVRTQVAPLPIRFKRPKWFSKSQRTAYIEWNQTGHAHLAYIDPSIFPMLQAYWTEFMLYVGEKINEICQDPLLDENWKPTACHTGTVRVLNHRVQRGIAVDILLDKPIAIRLNFDQWSIDVIYDHRKISIQGQLWRIKFPWSITFAAIKEVIVTQSAPPIAQKSISSFTSLSRGFQLDYIQSCLENEDEHVEVELLQLLLERSEFYDVTKESSLRDLIQILMRCPVDKNSSPKLLSLRLEITSFLLDLQTIDPNGSRYCSQRTADFCEEYIVFLARQYEFGSIGAEKLAQIIRYEVEIGMDLAYLLSVFEALLRLNSFRESFLSNNGMTALWNRYSSLVAVDRASQEFKGAAPCTTYTTLNSLSRSSPSHLMLRQQTSKHPVAVNEILNQLQVSATEAGKMFALHSISFLYDEMCRRKTQHPPILPEIDQEDRVYNSKQRRVQTSFIKPLPSKQCLNCSGRNKILAIQILNIMARFFESRQCEERNRHLEISAIQVQMMASELIFLNFQMDSCWRRLFVQVWLRIFQSWVTTMTGTLDLIFFQQLVDRIHQQLRINVKEYSHIVGQLLASLPLHLDEKHMNPEQVYNTMTILLEKLIGMASKTRDKDINTEFEFSLLEVWRVILLSFGSPLIHSFVLFLQTGAPTQRHIITSIGNKIQTLSTSYQQDYFQWLEVISQSLRKLTNVFNTSDSIQKSYPSTWAFLLKHAGGNISSDDMSITCNSLMTRVLDVLPEIDFNTLNASSAQNEYYWIKSHFHSFQSEKYIDHHVRGLLTQYLTTNCNSLINDWRCLNTLLRSSRSHHLEEFVIYQLFPFSYSIRQSQPTSSIQIMEPRLSIPTGLTQSGSIPLLQLSKLPSMTNLVESTFQQDQGPTNKPPIERLCHRSNSDMFVQMILFLLDSMICKTDHQSLNSMYCGRYGGLKPHTLGLDLLFWLQELLNSEKCHDMISRLASQIVDTNAIRLRSKLCLFKLSVLSLSDRVVYFRGFDPPRQGAFGTTYRCTSDMPLFRQFAIPCRQSIALKIIPSQVLANERSILYAVYNEVAILQHLRGSPCAIQMYDYGISKDGYFIAMEYAPFSLKVWREHYQTSLTMPLVIHIFLQICHSVHELHKNAVAHLDIKCDNILIRHSNFPHIDVCLGDFGESFLATSATENYFDCHYARGTEAIQSPEMIEFVHKISFSSDIWSLGCLFYEILTGKMLFENVEWPTLYNHLTKSNESILMKDHMSWMEQALSELVPDSNQFDHYRRGIIDLLEYILVREPTNRPTIECIIQRANSFVPSLPIAESISKPNGLTSFDIMCQQVRLLDGYKPDRHDKIKLSERLYLGSHVPWDGEYVIYITDQGVSNPTTITLNPSQSHCSDEREKEYALQLLQQVKHLSKRLWESFLANRVALLDVSSQEILRAIMPAIYVYHMIYYGISSFELVKQAWKPFDLSLIPPTPQLAAILCWEESRCISTSPTTYQCVCGSVAIQTLSSPEPCCTTHCSLCSACTPLVYPLTYFNVAKHRIAWIDGTALIAKVDIARWEHWETNSSPNEEVAANSDGWILYRCTQCKFLTRASKNEKILHAAVIQSGQQWNHVQRQLFFQL